MVARVAIAIGAPSFKRMQRVLVVPWSMAATNLAVTTQPFSDLTMPDHPRNWNVCALQASRASGKGNGLGRFHSPGGGLDAGLLTVVC